MARKIALVKAAGEPAPEPEGLKSWALVELFGHQRIVGWVTVDPVDFPGMVRVDVPDTPARQGFTRYVGRGALYAVNPIDEATVLKLLPHIDGRPARPIELDFGTGKRWGADADATPGERW